MFWGGFVCGFIVGVLSLLGACALISSSTPRAKDSQP